MTINLPDDILKDTGLTERDLLIELACRLFDAEKLGKSAAAKLCGMDRTALEFELDKRGLALYHYTEKDWELDQKAIKRAGWA
jgi:predicted HTH domain antitoxin